MIAMKLGWAVLEGICVWLTLYYGSGGALALGAMLLILPLGVGHQDDDRSQADDDAQHGQGRAALLGRDGFGRDLEGLIQIHWKAPSLSPS